MLRERIMILNNFEKIDINNYLTIEALEDNLTVSLSVNECEYCVNDIGNWRKLVSGTTTVSINEGQTLSFRGNLTPTSNSGIGTFTITKKCNIKGNIMSMLFGDNANKKKSLNRYNYAFKNLFKDCDKIINVSSKFLPATTLSSYCYYGLFDNCTSLINSPTLQGKVSDSCYYAMFRNCTSLVEVSDINESGGTTASYYCAYMFYGCTSLVNMPKIASNVFNLSRGCYSHMFYGCTSLVNISYTCRREGAFGNCYNTFESMFYGCTSIVDASNIDISDTSTYMGNSYTFSKMFYGCTSLVTGPKSLYAFPDNSCYSETFRNCTSLKQFNFSVYSYIVDDTITRAFERMFYNCKSLTDATFYGNGTKYGCNEMFYGCTSLKKVFIGDCPLNDYCYRRMFYGCSKLNDITAGFIDTLNDTCLEEWVYGVSSSGTFTRNSECVWYASGVNGIPNGWDIEEISFDD